MTQYLLSSPPRNGASADERDVTGILHFDATLHRKEKMRQRAEQPQSAPPAEAAPSNTPPPPRTNGRAQAARGANGSLHGAGGNGAALSRPVPAPAPVVAVANTPPPAAARISGAALERFLVEFVVEQTGYPEEMVELDADLEADLGIDSIKKAQLFGELAEQFKIQAADTGDLSLDDFPTLRHVMRFLEGAEGRELAVEGRESVAVSQPVQSRESSVESQPITRSVPMAGAASAAAASPGLGGPELERFLIGFVVEQTGYPEEMVELDADLEADLGIDSIKKAQLFGELAEHFEIRPAEAGNLSLDDFPTLRHVLEFLQAAPAGQQAETGGGRAEGPSPLAAAAPARPALIARPEPADAVDESPEFSGADDLPGDAAMPRQELERFLIGFVVEQTGYPEEMVELDADLEADLGIDSIKKAQLFGELAEQFEIRTTDTTNLSLDDFPTLRHVLEFLAGAPRRMMV
ncbi:MAG TPA: phosphopantetheine-binding protein [Planctomycetaceae bacterium]|nr:phosphopantetheine-binding protein [Planctomycetaceae bacterium]